jgi:5'-3' exonuclease
MSKKNNSKDKYYNNYTYHLNWMSKNKKTGTQEINDMDAKNENPKGFYESKSLDFKKNIYGESSPSVPHQEPKKIMDHNIHNGHPHLNQQRWIIIDASSIIFRYFYANQDNTHIKNQHISAVAGFCKIVLSFLHSPLLRGRVIVVFDGAKKNFKKNFDGAYKGKRKPLPDGLKEQLLLAEEFCMQANIFFDKHILYEADDLIASYATQLPGEIYIVAYDKDFFQLINDRIFLWDYRKTIKIDRQWVYEKYGVYPEQMVDFWCLVGDMSDNLFGVSGIGKKRAAQLLLKYDNLNNILVSPVANQYDFQTAVNLKKIIKLKTDIVIKDFLHKEYVNFTKMNELLRKLDIKS